MDLWDNIRQNDIHIVGVPKEEKGPEKIFEELMADNIPNLGRKEKDIQVQEAQRIRQINKMNAKRTTPRHIIIQMTKVKGKARILKAARDEQLITHKENG